MTFHNVIYLDYMSTTPVDPRVAEIMQRCLISDGDFGNAASSTHVFGANARARINVAASQVADLIQCDPNEITWTSSATESIYRALTGVALFYQRQGKHIITMTTEHKAVLDTCHYLEKLGFEVTYLNPEKNGLLNLKNISDAIRKDTILCSIMHVNNETGIIQDIASIGKLLKEKGVWFHVDAAQSVGKLPINLKTLPVDLMSLSAHKIYGPKGVGALFMRRQPRVQLMNTMRFGTLPTHQIAGMGEACLIAKNNMSDEINRIEKLRNQLWKNLSAINSVHLNGDLNHQVCGCLNISIDNMDADTLIKNCPDIAISTGSACNSVDPEPSHVLLAMGLSRQAANSSIRISMGRYTTVEDIEVASRQVINLSV
ncbi:MAG: IscS subfamily cysteine desulfurase [Gammaproteobacteria bacterium RIFCSPHIGHO2_12_FULL_38_11]|nr:MAG: IscS subfamily cysteine desulfurase [Gammaproteobacteria bacterium RIFCSPHIGHO2_12_FULL_38_11]